MPLLCIQCAMEAMVRGELYIPAEESGETHQLRVHPDLDATRKRRKELEAVLADRMATGMPIALMTQDRETQACEECARSFGPTYTGKCEHKK